MADQTELRMNLVAIKRVDPYAKDIVNTSAHVAFYTFNSADNEWEKTDVEGALFIYSRNAEPFHSVFINNRLNTNSLVEPITGQIELQTQPPFLLYRNERSRIRGFWFYNSTECDRIGDIIGRLVKECETKSNSKNNNNHPNQMDKSQSNNIDIFTMLTKAQEDFNNSANTSVLSETTMAPHMATLNKSSSSAINIVASSSQTTTTTHNVTPQSVMNFFAAAKQPAASEVPLFQRLMPNPLHTVEQIEKQHRASTPTGRTTPDVNDIENSFKFMGIPGMSQGHQQVQELGTSPLATFLNSSNLVNNRNAVSATKTKPMDILHLESSSRQQPLHELLKKSEKLNNSLNTSSATSNNISAVQGKPALMPPTMFQSSFVVKRAPGQDYLLSGPLSKNMNVINTAPPPLEPPQNNNHHQVPEPLTQNQLIQAINYLIKNDPDFIKKLHEAYLKSFTEMVSL